MDLLRTHAEMFSDYLGKLYDEMPMWAKVAVTAGGLITAVYIPYSYCKPSRRSPIKEDYEKDVIYLYQFPRIKHIPNISPYCLKLETWFRIADLKYQIVPCGWHTRSKEGTVPFIELNGEEYSDSSLIIEEMAQKFGKEDITNHLDDDQLATARAFIKMTEHSLYETVAIIRTGEKSHEVFAQFPEKDFGMFAPIRKCCMERTFRKRILNRVKTAGIGKHSRENIIKIANDDLKAISDYLGDKEYFTGIKATSVDASLFGVLAQIIYTPYDLPQKTAIIEKYNNLLVYCNRIKDRFWPDWDECTTNFTTNSDWKSMISGPKAD